MKFLIIKLSALGDVVQTLPSLYFIKKEIPYAKIHWIIDERNALLLKNHPLIEKVFVFSNKFFKNIFNFWQFIKGLRREEYDVVIDYQGLFKSGILTFFAKSSLKAGFANSKEPCFFFYSYREKIPYNIHSVKRYLLLTSKVLKFLGKDLKHNDFKISEKIFLPFEDYPLHNEKHNEREDFIISIIPEARWLSKMWPLFFWEELIDRYLSKKNNIKVLILGSGKDIRITDWANRVSQKNKKVVSLVGKLNLLQLIGIIKKSKIVITVDTGPMHIASLLNIPIIALFGPTSPERTGPWGRTFKVIGNKTSCSPCFKKACKEMTCMKNISPKEVFWAVEQISQSF